ncbi:hypothetical protein T484DRAFT_1882535 [Baffinella frigidus]|nr:hypothetical protein T484DRAFT_1882535 [Cryptophyta sp. CCMP2293]
MCTLDSRVPSTYELLYIYASGQQMCAVPVKGEKADPGKVKCCCGDPSCRNVVF